WLITTSGDTAWTCPTGVATSGTDATTGTVASTIAETSLAILVLTTHHPSGSARGAKVTRVADAPGRAKVNIAQTRRDRSRPILVRVTAPGRGASTSPAAALRRATS